MEWPETVENLIGALVCGLLCALLEVLYFHETVYEAGETAAYASFFFVCVIGVHWLGVNLWWEVRSRMRKKRLLAGSI